MFDSFGSGADAIARVALPALVQMKGAGAAVILDDCPAARSLRADLGLDGSAAVCAVDREKLVQALADSAWYFAWEADYIDAEHERTPGALPVFVVCACGTWLGYLLDGELYELLDTPGECETRESMEREIRQELN